MTGPDLDDLPGRRVTVVVLDAAGALMGAVPTFDVPLPWWQDTQEVVGRAEEHVGGSVDVLRLLTADRPMPHGGRVTYLAQLRTPTVAAHRDLLDVDAATARLVAEEDPLRLPYARPGGPASTVDWALSHCEPGTTAVQQRTWNLSAIWCLHGPAARVWLKQVPPFLAHEDVVLRWADGAAPGTVPRLLADGDVGGSRRLLLEEVAGRDLYEAGGPVRAALMATAQSIHERSVGAVDRLVADGVPDRRGSRLVAWVADQLAGHVDGHPAQELLAGLPERMAAIEACGLPEVLVHGDLHPGNAIGDARAHVLIDWGDSFVGHPGFDVLRLTAGLPPEDTRRIVREWADGSGAGAAGCDPEGALRLLPVLEALRAAAVYAGFLARIEPGERPYHAADVPDCLHRAVVLSRAEAAVRGRTRPGSAAS